MSIICVVVYHANNKRFLKNNMLYITIFSWAKWFLMIEHRSLKNEMSNKFRIRYIDKSTGILHMRRESRGLSIFNAYIIKNTIMCYGSFYNFTKEKKKNVLEVKSNLAPHKNHDNTNEINCCKFFCFTTTITSKWSNCPRAIFLQILCL